MSKHTPGPWTAVWGDPFYIFGQAAGSDSYVCKVMNYCDESEANAELIARAPELQEQNAELVAALKKQVMYLENILAPETRPVPIYRTLITEAKKRAKIALAKQTNQVKGDK